MAIEVVISIFSGVSVSLAFWWSNLSVPAVGVSLGALLLFSIATLVYELWSLDKELRALDDRVRRLAELRAKSKADDSAWPA